MKTAIKIKAELHIAHTSSQLPDALAGTSWVSCYARQTCNCSWYRRTIWLSTSSYTWQLVLVSLSKRYPCYKKRHTFNLTAINWSYKLPLRQCSNFVSSNGSCICCARYAVPDMLRPIYGARYAVPDMVCPICCARYAVPDMLCPICCWSLCSSASSYIVAAFGRGVLELEAIFAPGIIVDSPGVQELG